VRVIQKLFLQHVAQKGRLPRQGDQSVKLDGSVSVRSICERNIA
jgi:hypothetical protein